MQVISISLLIEPITISGFKHFSGVFHLKDQFKPLCRLLKLLVLFMPPCSQTLGRQTDTGQNPASTQPPQPAPLTATQVTKHID